MLVKLRANAAATGQEYTPSEPPTQCTDPSACSELGAPLRPLPRVVCRYTVAEVVDVSADGQRLSLRGDAATLPGGASVTRIAEGTGLLGGVLVSSVSDQPLTVPREPITLIRIAC